MCYSELAFVDLDGTLCNTEHRDRFARNKNWSEFHSNSKYDTINEDVWWLIDKLNTDGVAVFALTGRPELYRQDTINWLMAKSMGLSIVDVIMRENKDFRKDFVIKPLLLDKHFSSREHWINRTKIVIENSDDVVAEFRNLGVNTWQVRPNK